MKGKIRNLLPILAVVLVGACGGLLTSVMAFTQDYACSVGTLNGSYGIQSTGSIVAFGPIGPIAEAGIIKFDGLGGVSQTTTVSIGGLGGQIIPDRTSLSGSYTVNPDCSGDLALVLPSPSGPIPSTFHFVIVDHRKALRLVNTR